MVENSDWAKELAKTTDELIWESVLPSYATHCEQETLEDVANDQEVMVEAVRSIIAKELAKIVHAYRARNELQAPTNVAYWVEQRQTKLTESEMAWHVTTHYSDGKPETYPVDSFAGAHEDATKLRTVTGIDSVDIWYGARKHA